MKKVMINSGVVVAMMKFKVMKVTMNSWAEMVKIGCLDKQETTNFGVEKAKIFYLDSLRQMKLSKV
ncbi:hypothetical protein BAZSYMA_ACONTIG24851_5 [Bathymodiolus azoricus thioautotrophic gill symbiont]|uniref:Uncharacterized protein n=1 Tax=Bathymodiolus azoricus thioautotrophic gill symbiont TaxID=235205 RepID=A0A1H6LPZ4_9GAMM|nr:hypothetical protein BAZSYMA_ACONTIG24851_5 [Bathymodiolus azoricus thioautotrophic gill symbiont]